MQHYDFQEKQRLIPTDFATDEETQFWLAFNKYMTYIIEILEFPIYWTDINSRVMYVNDIGLNSIHILPQNMIGKTAYDYYPKEIADGLQKTLDYVFQTKQRFNDRHYTTDYTTGQIKTFKATLDPIFNPDTGNLMGLLGVSIEVPNDELSQFEQVENNKRLAIMHTDKLLRNTLDRMYGIMLQERNNLFNSALGQYINNQEIESVSEEQINLEPDEEDILCFLSNHKTLAEISQLFLILRNQQITPDEVNQIIITKLYPKFEAYSISQLLDNAARCGAIPFLIKAVR